MASNKIKIFNDPIYGLISFPFEMLYEIIDHEYFQRLRRISQLGLTSYVYPGANHTRFHHALGATHLMDQAIQNLRNKNVNITDAEYKAACIAILLHDIGHGPFSHALEGQLVPFRHEEISLAIMHQLNEEFDGELSLAIEIFKGKYEKPFLTQLVSSQLDMDRMDYIIRDSYFTGVAEGVIGYDRLIKMLNVVDGELVVEEKGIYSIEKFLVARRLMYWQVYLHKTAVGAEKMLKLGIQRLKKLHESNVKIWLPKSLESLFFTTKKAEGNLLNDNSFVPHFSQVDDIDIMAVVKENRDHPDFILSYMFKSILKRNLFRVYLQSDFFRSQEISSVVSQLVKELGISEEEARSLVISGKESNQGYNSRSEEIRILQKEGEVIPLSEYDSMNIVLAGLQQKHYLCYPSVVGRLL